MTKVWAIVMLVGVPGYLLTMVKVWNAMGAVDPVSASVACVAMVITCGVLVFEGVKAWTA